ncbi:hypothetical protein, partial [Aeromonas caviae]|uniref:hypothetical protein n=1 Tax=Aeromonas caviae TaxID=648 RepID=UPI001CC42CDD
MLERQRVGHRREQHRIPPQHRHPGPFGPGVVERAGVTVLRGDPVLFAAVADSLPFQHRYSSAAISWAVE